MLEHEIESKSRLLAKLVWELLKGEPFETLADLTEALKCRCARLKIRWTNDDIVDAYRLIRSNTPLPGDPIRHVWVERKPEPEIIDRDTAATLLQQMPAQIKRMTDIRQLSPAEIQRRRWQADQRKALLIVEQEILDAVRRCEALEQEHSE